MSKKLFVTGTGTDIGKTYVTALLVKKLNESGLNPGYYKAAVSGNLRDEKGELIPGDAKFVKDISGIKQPLEKMCPYVYERAFSPHLASRIEGNDVNKDEVVKGFEENCLEYDYVIMEGSGGIICPIRFNEEKIMLEDFINELSLPCVVVADAGLGTINNVVLTVEYMKMKNINIKGIIFNNYIEEDIMHEDNKYMCEYLTGINVIATVSKNDNNIEIDEEILKGLFED